MLRSCSYVERIGLVKRNSSFGTPLYTPKSLSELAKLLSDACYSTDILMNLAWDWSIRPCELFWIAHQPYLLENGYKLPARYDPNWIPSWETNKRLDPITCPDSQGMSVSLHRYSIMYKHKLSYSQPGIPILDAIRISDGKKVVLKLVEVHKDVPIMEYLNSPDLLADPRNHTVPLLDKLSVPDREDVVWIVIPLLIFFQSPSHPFQYVSEVVDLAKQFLEVSFDYWSGRC